MKTFYVLVLSMIITLPLAGFSGAAVAQDGRWVTGTTASGETVRVKIVSQPGLKYPRRAQRNGIEGFVVLNFDIDETGGVVDLRVADSKPRLVFDKVATRYIKKWRFAPPAIDGTPVYVGDISMRIPFRLE
jgi:protein TonB